MKKVTFAIMGMGNRGTAYASKQFKFPDDMQVVAMADTRKVRTDAANKYLHLPENMIFSSGEEMLEKGKLADVLIIATQDGQHREHALKALELGYDLLLEKPMAVTPEDCVIISEKAKKLGRKVIICHVLRYTPFYREVKRIIDSGELGKIESITAAEEVGYYHYAHSYVRGNWHKEATSSPMILAKCCHDMDMMLWLTGKNCKKVSSFGSQDYFVKENCPEGAPKRCIEGCPVEDCPYNAPKFYVSRIPGWPANILHPEPTEENMLEACRTTDYGKCVFQCDNDVVDHQVVNMELDDGITVNFSMCGFTKKQQRSINIMGTKAQLTGITADKKITVSPFNGEPYEIDLTKICDDFSGHGGGDTGLIKDVIRFMRGDDFDTSAITLIDRSTESHMLAFAAEKSRVEGGKVVDLPEYIASYIK